MILVATTKFVPLAQMVAKARGMPGIRIAEIPHPLGGATPDQIEQLGAIATERILAILAGNKPT